MNIDMLGYLICLCFAANAMTVNLHNVLVTMQAVIIITIIVIVIVVVVIVSTLFGHDELMMMLSRNYCKL